MNLATFRNFQTLCLLLIPIVALGLGIGLVYAAVRCDINGGLEFDKDGGIVCRTRSENLEGRISTAVVMRVSVLLLVLVTVSTALFLCVWYSRNKRSSKQDSRIYTLPTTGLPVVHEMEMVLLRPALTKLADSVDEEMACTKPLAPPAV